MDKVIHILLITMFIFFDSRKYVDINVNKWIIMMVLKTTVFIEKF